MSNVIDRTMKRKATFSITNDTLDKFDEYARENATNKSAFIEKLLKKFLSSIETGDKIIAHLNQDNTKNC